MWSVSLLLCCCGKARPEGLTIATAANMQFAMEELTTAFTEATGIACVTVVSSSGKLTAQIREGAPFDVFVSADLKYPESLHAAGFTVAAPQVYAYGQLVLWTKVENLKPSLSLLTDASIKHIALANPKTAPYGRAAQQLLTQLGIFDTLQPKLVYGESIAQTNQFVISQAAELGFTARAVVEAPSLSEQGSWLALPPDNYDPIAQGAVVVRGTAIKEKQGQAFIDFLLSPPAQEILSNFGYLATDSPIEQ